MAEPDGTLSEEGRLVDAEEQENPGEWAEAEAKLRAALADDPEHAESLHRLGLLVFEGGRADEGLALVRRAIDVKPAEAHYHRDLGTLLERRTAYADAEVAYRRATELQQGAYRSRAGLARMLSKRGKIREAAAEYRRAVELKPSNYWARRALAKALERLGDLDGAETEYRRAAELRPDYYLAHVNLAKTLARQGRGDAAETAWRQALACKPDCVPAHIELSILLRANWTMLDEAEFHSRRAVELAPEGHRAWRELGWVRWRQHRLAEAAEALQRAAELAPRGSRTLLALGAVLSALGRLDEARAALDRAIELRPDFAWAHTKRAFLALSCGNFAEGWRHLAWRLKSREYCQGTPLARDLPQPEWDGADLAGRRVLLRSERNLVDTLQFLRYADLVRQRGGRCVLECQRALYPLLKDHEALDHVVIEGEPLPPFDVHAPLLSLPGLFQTDLHSIPHSQGYLRGAWPTKFRRADRPTIGLAWRVRPGTHGSRRQDLNRAQFHRLFKHGDHDFVSLQPGQAGDRLHSLALRPGRRAPVTSEAPRRTFGDDLVATAAVIQELDLVITTDSIVAHLAGALGKPVWTLLSKVPDWRWMLEGDDSPWYASMRLFRQTKQDQWDDVIEAVEQALLAKDDWSSAA